MINQIFPWKRFWCSRTGTLSLNDNGFFIDPESELARFHHKGVVAFQEIQETPCLILLGEPGIGKTTTINSEIRTLESQIISSNKKLIYKNLNEYGDENRLIREVFESSTIKSWQKGKHHLYLFLDSIDECLIEIPQLAIILKNQFYKLKDHSSRLSLRISCRTADWPEMLKDELDLIWGENEVGAYELAPLRRKDVSEAAHAFGLEPSCFIEAIKTKEIQSLAGSPITLKFLLEEFKCNQQFSLIRSELFLRGCRHLCTENNPDRQTTQHTGVLSTAKRLALASRIAAVMIFCNRSSICLQENISDSKETDLTLQMLQEGEETTGDHTFSFTEEDLREVVKYSALFSSRGPHRFGFVHQSYMEFLAARYLTLHQLSIQQIKSLIYLSNDPDQMVIPQLKETIAWLNSVMPVMIQETIKTDPQSMLSSDIASMIFRFRRDLVESLLKQFEQQIIVDSDWGRYSQYQKLKHPELELQLKPYIKDKTKHFLVRRVAIDIAEECEVKTLQNLLANVALDNSDMLQIRDQAAHAVSKIADTKTRLRLKPLAMKKQQDDEEDQLKGSALRALWPEHLNTQKTLKALTPPKQDNFFGNYAGFLTEFPDQLGIDDLPTALQWAKNNPGERTGFPHQYTKLTERILFRAWHHLDKKKILEAYAEAIIPRIENYLSICPSSTGGIDDQLPQPLTNETRKNLIKALVRKVKKYRKHSLVSSMVRPQIIFDNDLEWLIRELKAERKHTIKEIWVEIIHDVYRPDNPDHTEVILQTIPGNKMLSDKFQIYFEAVKIDSLQAKEARNSFAKYKKLEMQHKKEEDAQKKAITPSVYERIKTCLEQFENGDSDAWFQLCMEMTLEATSRYYGNELNSDLISQPGWKVCDEALKKRIVKAAKKYILENDANTSHWLGKDISHRPATAGYKAFIILKQLEPEFLNNLLTDRWEKWASIILAYPEISGVTCEDETYLKIIKQAYDNAPQEIIDTLLILIDKEEKKYDCLFILRKIENCLDKRLQDALLTKAKDDSIKPSCLQDLLSYLLRANNLKSKSYAEDLLALPLSKDSKSLMRSKASALALLTHAKDAGWEIVWAVIRSDTEFGKDILMSLPNSPKPSNSKSLPDRIGEHSTADLFIWLSKHFQREEDPKEEGAHWVKPRESLAHYRDSLLRSLQEKGTQESLLAIEQIKKELPDLDSLNFYLVKARENVRRTNWLPLSTNDFLLLTKDPSSRLIINADHLLEALMESLMRLERKLQGETPNAIFLWNDIPNSKKLRPKPEERFSDFVKTHLTEDLSGVIALREVEIRQPKLGDGGSAGERVDIYVIGYVPLTKKNVRVIIEVKGCWNQKVKTDMKKQLLNRYLNESGCDHGIYLVGWFSCNQWDKKDRRKNKTSSKDIEKARKKFDNQAMELSTDQKTIKSFVMNCALR